MSIVSFAGARRLALLLISFVSSLAALAAQVPSPEQYLGQQIGADHFLANYTQLRGYWAELAAASDRMQVQTFGETSYGQPMEMAVISSPQNLARLEQIRTANLSLALGRIEDREAAREVADQSRAIIWIDAGMHATEAVAAQNIIELTYRMTSRDDAEVRRILDEVVLLVVPANPDGLEMIANAYMATKRVGDLPVLYQRYIGHDNNRDYYAANQPETRALCRAIYHRWLPQVLYNHHQTAPAGTIIFTPPFRDPYNHNFDPMVVRGIEIVAAHMNRRFASEGKPGVISRSGASYSAWWNGGLRTMVSFHNIIGILTESFGRPEPTEIKPSIDRRVPYSDYPDPVPPQTWHARQTIEYLQTANFAILDYASRYRRELLLDQWQMARNSIERGRRPHWTSTPKLAEIAKARDAHARVARRESRNADATAAEDRVAESAGAEGTPAAQSEGASAPIGEGTSVAADPAAANTAPAPGDASSDAAAAVDASALVDAFADPELADARCYMLSSDQPNFSAVTRLVRSLRYAAIEVHRATRDLEVDGRRYPAGSFFLFADQAFRPHLRDMFEPQWHPDLVGSGGEPVRPYDAAGWTLAFQHDIRFERSWDDVLRDGLELVEEIDVPFAPRRLESARGEWFELPLAEINSYAAIHRLLAAGEELREVGVGVDAAVCVRERAGTAQRIEKIAHELGLRVARRADVPADARALRPLRIGLFDVYGGHMATGWTEWALREFEFPVELVFAPRIDRGDLRADYDVLLFHTGLPAATRRDRTQGALRGRRGGVSDEQVAKITAALPPFEDWSTAVERNQSLDVEVTVPALREFVERGGVLLTFDDQSTRIAKHFELSVDEGVWVGEGESRRRARDEEFFVPGSLLWIDLAADDPLGRGCGERLAAMFRRNPVFVPSGESIETIAAYAPSDELLASGWAKGTDLLAGKSAVMRAKLGAGSVYMFGADVMYRGQPLGTMKLVFNAILTAGE